jgi:LacI family transcriptional regulator
VHVSVDAERDAVAKQATLGDVAAAAKVDLSTASRVLRGGGRASDATRQRIFDAAARLNFRPNAQGQFLATGISKTVGVLTLDAPSTFTMPVLAGVNRALGRKDIATLLYDTDFDETKLRESVLNFHARSIDGLLVIGNGLMTRIRSITEGFDVPVIYAFGVPDDETDTWFLPDGVMAGRMAGEHLIGLGRRRIAHVTAAGDLAAAERARGLGEALAEAGLELALGAPLEGTWQRDWGVEAAHRILDSGAEIDAIFCGNDQIALGIYGVLRAAGVRVPEDVALVGYDNWERMTDVTHNLLTTIEPDLVGLGYAAGEYLAAVTNGTFEPGPHYHPCSLVLGESTLGVGASRPADPEGWA